MGSNEEMGFKTKTLEILLETIIQAGIPIGKFFQSIGIEQEPTSTHLKATAVWQLKGETKEHRETISIPNRYFKSIDREGIAGLMVFDLVLPEVIASQDTGLLQ